LGIIKKNGGETLKSHERVRIKKITEQYGKLKDVFNEFTKKIEGYKKGLEGFGCSISERNDLSISLLTPFDATILISFSAPLLVGSKLWGKLTIEKQVEDKEKDNVKIWELYLDDLCNFMEILKLRRPVMTGVARNTCNNFLLFC
jgi:hypothetical protein